MGALLKGFLSALIPMLSATLLTTAGKIITATGLSFISFTGMNIIEQKFIDFVQDKVGQFSADALQLMMILGVGTCLNWIFGTFSFVVTVKSMSKLSAILSTSKG